MILIATGAEVGLTFEAAKKIAADGPRYASSRCRAGSSSSSSRPSTATRCAADVKARLSIEPGVELGWSKWVGDQGGSISIERYGASAPGGTVLDQFGYNLDNVVARATALLERVA